MRRIVMSRRLDWCDEASVVHQAPAGPVLPSGEAAQRMRAGWRPS